MCWWLLLLFLLACDGSHGYLMVPGRNCTTVRFEGKISVAEMDVCDRLLEASGCDRTDYYCCDITMCDLPASGPVAEVVYGIDIDQDSRPDSDSRFRVGIWMKRLDCDRIYGTYDGYPSLNIDVKCGLYLTERDGSDRDNVDTLVFSSPGETQHKLATAKLSAYTSNCVQAGGTWDNELPEQITCKLDICLSPAVNCEPSDAWVPVQTCSNPSSSTFECVFEETTGIERELTSEGISGGSWSLAVGAEVGFNLMEIFATATSITGTVGFDWARSVGSKTLWRSATTRTMTVTLHPGQSVTLEQVVGKCGPYSVHTSEFRMTNT